METATLHQSPHRITDIIAAKTAGADLRLEIQFEILPVEFHHRQVPFQAYIFLGHYRGTIDGSSFKFRKCYARGCPNNLCTHVSQAVNIANHYLQRDFHALISAGIDVQEKLFSLNEMMVQFDKVKETEVKALSIPELIAMAALDRVITIHIHLELIPAVANFSDLKAPQTFFSGEFIARGAEGDKFSCQRCLACYAN